MALNFPGSVVLQQDSEGVSDVFWPLQSTEEKLSYCGEERT